MTGSTQTLPRPAAVVLANFDAFARGDVEAVRRGWHDDAVWHITGSSEFAGDLHVDDYLQVLGTSLDPSRYHGEIVGLLERGELVVVEWHSEGAIGDTELDGEGGLMIYRVIDGKVSEGWSIASGSGGTVPF